MLHNVNLEVGEVSLRIQSECQKMRTRKLLIRTLSTQCWHSEIFLEKDGIF